MREREREEEEWMTGWGGQGGENFFQWKRKGGTERGGGLKIVDTATGCPPRRRHRHHCRLARRRYLRVMDARDESRIHESRERGHRCKRTHTLVSKLHSPRHMHHRGGVVLGKESRSTYAKGADRHRAGGVKGMLKDKYNCEWKKHSCKEGGRGRKCQQAHKKDGTQKVDKLIIDGTQRMSSMCAEGRKHCAQCGDEGAGTRS